MVGSTLQHWILAARPKTLTAAAAPVLVGSGMAYSHGAVRLLPGLAALVGALLIQIATNLANDYYDFVRGGDTAERVGPIRVTQAGLIAPERVKRAMYAVLLGAVAVGSYLVWIGGWPILVIGLLSLVCAVAYTGGPLPLAYHGLGDVFVFVFFGLVAVGGTYWVHTLTLPGDVLWAGVGMGALNTAILVVNNLRDLKTDARAGKRTLAVRIGQRGARLEYGFLLLVAALVPPLGMLRFEWGPSTLLALVALLLALGPIRAVWGDGEAETLIPALGGTARVAGLYGLLLGVGFALG